MPFLSGMSIARCYQQAEGHRLRVSRSAKRSSLASGKSNRRQSCKRREPGAFPVELFQHLVAQQPATGGGQRQWASCLAFVGAIGFQLRKVQ